MQRTDHPLLSPSLGSQKTLTSFHYGTPCNRPKVYIQASLHAEELPGMLVAHHLRGLLEAAEASHLIQGEIIVVPVANAIGPLVRDALGDDPQANVVLVRSAVAHFLRDWVPATELQSLRRTLLM